MKVAIIGCGFSGMASALLLSKRKNIEITIFEKFSEVKAVGAGVTIQPSSIEVLKSLNLYNSLLEHGEKIYNLYGTNHKGKKVFHTSYADYEENSFGIGIHRSVLFNLLYEKASAKDNIRIVLDSDITDLENLKKEYNLVIIANGTNSNLRKLIPVEQKCNLYPYGCIWTTIEDSDCASNKLEQYVKYSNEMFGLLPSGFKDGKRLVSVFWSLPLSKQKDYSKENILAEMSKYNIDSEVMKKISSANFTVASYNDVYMKSYNHENIVVIGDAAHGMSPQLGQGINMGLIDAYILNQALDESNIDKSLMYYSKKRKQHLAFYTQASKFLTPLYQSDNWYYGLFRDYLFTVNQKIPFARKMSAHILHGKRLTWWSNREINYK